MHSVEIGILPELYSCQCRLQLVMACLIPTAQIVHVHVHVCCVCLQYYTVYKKALFV